MDSISPGAHQWGAAGWKESKQNEERMGLPVLAFLEIAQTNPLAHTLKLVYLLHM